MPNSRKRHVQQDLFGRDKSSRGKTRKRGRPRKARAGSPHKKRPMLKSQWPVHVVLRVVAAVTSLRKRHMYRAIRSATLAVAKSEDGSHRGAFRIVHVSIQRNHIHLIVEAEHKSALSRGMQGFQISAAKHLNAALSVRNMRFGTAAYRAAMTARRRGTVFPDRFHQEIITTPKQARHTLAYVLNNWRKHREDNDRPARTWRVDPFSTGVLFDGWKEREAADFYMPYRETYQPMIVYLPKTWLLREGWRRHGLIRFDEVPSAKKLQLQLQQPALAA